MRKLHPANVFVAPVLGTGLRLAVGEFPYEDSHPCSGGASNWLRGTQMSDGRRVGGMYSKAGIKDVEISYVNVIQCRPESGDFPTDPEARGWITEADAYEAVNHCLKHHVEPLLTSRPWKRLDLFGDKPLRFIAGKQGIFKWRGSPLAIDLLGDKPVAIPTLHPAYLAKDQLMYPVVVNDLSKSLAQAPENYNLLPSLADVQAFDATTFAADIETDGWNTDIIRMVGLCAKPTEAIVVPFQGAYIEELKRIFRNAELVITQNGIQFDHPVLEKKGIVCPKAKLFDVMLAHHLRFPELPHDLEFISSMFTNKPAWKHLKENFELYNARDVDVTMSAYLQLYPMLKQAGLLDLYENVQVPLAKICHLMHTTGIKIDPGHIEEARTRILQQMQALSLKLPEHLRTHEVLRTKTVKVPEGFIDESGKKRKSRKVEVAEIVHPWRSSSVMEKWLYTEQGLPVQKDIKTGKTSTGKLALDKLARYTRLNKPECTEAIEALRQLRKLNSLETLFCKEELAVTGWQHSSFNVHGTSSGRLSSSNPNLQNVPEGARYLYVPSTPGWKLIECDYSSGENRLTAYFSNDTERLNRFSQPGFNEHKYATSLFFGIPMEDVVKDNDKDAPYGKAKRVVHGSGYGLGALKMSKMYDMDFKETKKLMSEWKQLNPKLTEWQEATTSMAKKQGYLTTPFGRKHWFYTSTSYTESLSFLPQSTLADVCFRAMIALMYERINWPLENVLKLGLEVVEPLPQPANLLLQVHDALIVECPAEMVDEVVGVMKRVMEQPFKELGGFAIPVSASVGDSWGEMSKWKPQC